MISASTIRPASIATARSRRSMSSLASRCGYSADLSSSINDRAMFHADNAYYLPATRIVTKRAKTHTVSNTAFRGFGGPQGMIGGRADDGRHRLDARPRSARRAQAQSLRRGPRSHALRHAGRGQHLARDDRDAGAHVGLPRAPPRARGVQCAKRLPQAGPRADAGEVRDFVHHQPSQPGRRAGACLSGRFGAPQPRRHRDGAGALHQGGPGGGGGVRHRSRLRQDHRRPRPARSPTRRRPRPHPAPT